jgi:hypothetical protein
MPELPWKCLRIRYVGKIIIGLQLNIGRNKRNVSNIFTGRGRQPF